MKNTVEKEEAKNLTLKQGVLAALWIIIGSYKMIWGIEYILYGSMMVHVYTVPDSEQVQNVVFGAVYFVFGIFLLARPKVILTELYSLSLLLLSFSTFWNIIDSIKYGKFECDNFVLADYLLVFLAFASINHLKIMGKVMKSSTFKRVAKDNWTRLLIEIVLINLVILVLTLIVIEYHS